MDKLTTSEDRVWGGVACGIIAVVTAVWTYWMVVPGLLFGLAALVLGWRARARGATERANIALTLGIVALLLVPSVIVIADGAEQWGRDCALDPTSDPNC